MSLLNHYAMRFSGEVLSRAGWVRQVRQPSSLVRVWG